MLNEKEIISKVKELIESGEKGKEIEVNEIIGITENGIVLKWNGALVTIITATRITNVIKKFKNSEMTLPKTKTYFGAAVFTRIF